MKYHQRAASAAKSYVVRRFAYLAPACCDNHNTIPAKLQDAYICQLRPHAQQTKDSQRSGPNSLAASRM